MATILYGIPNCDIVRKARRWLADRGVACTFHDYKKRGVDEARLRGWIDRVGWESLLNRSGTTFRALPGDERREIDAERAIALMMMHPSLIRRPLVEHGDTLLIGFKPSEWEAAGL